MSLVNTDWLEENIKKVKYNSHNGLQETKYKVNTIEKEDNSEKK